VGEATEGGELRVEALWIDIAVPPPDHGAAGVAGDCGGPDGVVEIHGLTGGIVFGVGGLPVDAKLAHEVRFAIAGKTARVFGGDRAVIGDIPGAVGVGLGEVYFGELPDGVAAIGIGDKVAVGVRGMAGERP